MTREYDDKRYIEWTDELRRLLEEFLDTEGNTPESLRDEVENVIENWEKE